VAKLNGLTLNGNKIRDISPLAGMTRLTYLFLSNNQISTITSLAHLKDLKVLWLDENRIEDISSLPSMNPANIEKQVSVPTLEGLLGVSCEYPHLNLANNAIEDIGPLVMDNKLIPGYIVNLKGNPLNLVSGSPGIKKIEAMEAQGIKICY